MTHFGVVQVLLGGWYWEDILSWGSKGDDVT